MYKSPFDFLHKNYVEKEKSERLAKELLSHNLNKACKEGNLELIKKFRTKNYSYQPVINASEHGHLECVQYLVSDGAPVGDWAIFRAAENNHLNILKILIKHMNPKCKDSFGYVGAISAAANKGNFEIVKYLVINGFFIGDYAVRFATESGHIEIVKLLIESGANISLLSVNKALENNHLEIAKYLLVNGALYEEKSIEKFESELWLEIKEVLTEYIGHDISSLIFDLVEKVS